ncbi:MAG: lysophospholipid acyltransferase family protein [Gemmatimonadetes bacterium]|nr:lysophospholipid acyltransferase family protein [Gemmatimonadota bacterium]
MSSSGKRVKHAFETVGFRLLVGVVRRTPRAFALGLGSALGRFAFEIGIRRRVAVDNVLARLAPAGGRRAAVRVARESYAVIARTFVDLLRTDLESDAVIGGLVPREDLEPVLEVWRHGKGAMFVSGHFGNWELLLNSIRRLGVPVGAMAKDQSNTAVNEIVKSIRARGGITPLSSRRDLREAVRLLRGGGYVATLMDQDAGKRGEFVPFLGTPASTPSGAVTMAVRTGAPLVPGVLLDLGGSYRAAIGEPWWPPSAGEMPEEEAVRAGVLHYTRFLEEHVRAHPGNYFWAHRRWKTRPPGAKADS